MKFLNEIDGAHQLKTDPSNRLVTDSQIDSWDGKADKTYVDNKVKTDVPTGAVFTDTNTITSINGKTGIIAKADIVALGIPAQDTVYTHPATHPASMITGLPTSLPANGGNAATVGGFTVEASVPANAKFTDTNTTYSEISEAEINTGTASTLRTITARRITFIINKIKGVLTKADVGLSNVDNTSDVNKPVATTTTNGIMSSTDKISLNANTAVRHSHSNKAVLDKFDESGTQLRYNGEVVAIETVYTWAKLKGSMSWGNFLGQ